MVAPNFPYVAIRVIMRGDYTRAYNPGDLVPADAVEGPDAWLRVGKDVEKRDGKSKP
jgi:hypothetical protein